MKKLIVVGIFVALVGCGGGGGKGGNTGGTGGSATGTAGATGAAGTTGAGGTGACVTGQEGCACYGNDTCDGGLQCFSHLCVAATGTGGSATGTGGSATGTGGSAGGTGGSATGTGGSATGTGGSATGTGGSATGTGGSATGTGGSATGTGGTTGAGGSSQCATGSEGCACYGNDTCNGTLKCLSHLCVSLTGTGGSATGTGGSSTGTGGSATGTGGSSTGTGGSATGTGGTTGTGGSGTGGTNSNTLTFTAGVVTADSNSWGITGGVYTFGDGVGSMITPNCSTDNCFGDVTGAGPICVSGIGTRVLLNTAGTAYDYATYWGAAVALDLNNPTNMAMGQMAYVASTHGVKGFQFTFQNKASSVVRLTFKVRDPASGSLVDYCLDLGTTTSIIHFTDAKQQCYAAVPGPALTAALADHVEGLQWQVPTTASGAVSFNYCISNITPLTQ